MSLPRLIRTRYLCQNLAKHTPPTRTFLTTRPLFSPSEPTVLPRLHADLKNALRSKNKPALSVLRALLATITNASKTPKPITTDNALLALLQKTISTSKTSITEFQQAGREDLVTKEEEQISVLQAYVSEIPVMSEEEVRVVVKEVIAGEKKVVAGGILGKTLGKLASEDAAFDRQMLRRVVEEEVSHV
ncbi:GatB/YqeY domain-containing protein [Amniculicola lignicola CBS 123094]|uniref:Altered inheritance of mitochondria protein 41 n=1 Tax=Amniculicola lignicola CBS 123094 TaxID=1392246 RepID=A0A6A5WT90_9PLEO|nr:GatB/YqeY domain-containing protein [Amniculicola lignicola CBS 123094]